MYDSFMQDIPEVIVAAIDLVHFGGSYFAAFDIASSVICILTCIL